MFETLNEFGHNFVNDYGIWGLFILSFTDSFIQPVPPDPILATATAFGFDPWFALFVCLVGSILGGIIGYILGITLGHKVAVKLFGEKNMQKAEKFLLKWEFWGVLVIAFTPIPFKVATWSAGIFEMPFWQFMLASTIGRGVRFALVAFGTAWIFA